jgi:hypothetical protein
MHGSDPDQIVTVPTFATIKLAELSTNPAHMLGCKWDTVEMTPKPSCQHLTISVSHLCNPYPHFACLLLLIP